MADPIGCDHRLCPHLCLLIQHATPIPLLSPLAKGYREMPAIEGLVPYKHVKLGEPGVRLVSFWYGNKRGGFNATICICIHIEALLFTNI